MYLSRCLDDREVLLKQQNKIFFQVSGAGHEAVQVAAGMVLRAGKDWAVPYYRDRALALTLGITAEDMLLQAVGAARDPSSGGRQMPSHWSSTFTAHFIRVITDRYPVSARAWLCERETLSTGPDADDITLVCSGEGATSEGEFWECMNIACIERLPLLVLIEDNGYAISVPVEFQTAGGNISALLAGFPGLCRLEVDGTDFCESYRVMKQAADYCRNGHGPAIVHASVIRHYSHSLSDDERLYKPQIERQQEVARDPLRTFPEFLVQEGFIDRGALERLAREIDLEVQEITHRVLREPSPVSGSSLRFLYSDKIDPQSDQFVSEPHFEGIPRTMVDSINRTLAEEMRRDSHVIVFGEDVADCSRDQYLDRS